MSTTKNLSLLDILGDDFLVDRLTKAHPDEIAGLIDHLTDKGEGRVATGSAVKDMALSVKERLLTTVGAAEVLVAELQHYGGNVLANLARGKGVPYSQLLSDTLDYLGHKGPRDKQVHLLEDTILRQELEIIWNRESGTGQIVIAERLGSQPVFTEAKKALETGTGRLQFAEYLCGDKVNNQLLHSQSDVIERGSTAAGAPGGIAGALLGKLVGKTLSDMAPESLRATLGSALSSHRVTLPCINFLILMRLRQESGGRAQPRLAVPAEQDATADIGVGDALIIQDGDGNHAISVMQAALSGLPSNAKLVDGKKAGISRLSPLMQAAPTAFMASEVNGEGFMKVVINGPLKLAKDGNGYRGWSHDGKQITEQARLFDGDLSQVVNASALFNVASFALAQKHLADISAKLDEIKQGVDRISTFQKREREAEISSAIDYLQQIASPILQGELRAALEQKLEDAEADLLKVQNHLRSDLMAVRDGIQNARDEGKFGMSSFREKLTGLQSDFNELSHQWKLCLAARMMACRLLCNFQGVQATVSNREAIIRAELDHMLGGAGMISQIDTAIEIHLTRFSSAIGDSRIELQANRELVQIARQATLPSLRTETLQLASSFDAMLLDNKQPVELLVALQNGEVSEVAVL